MNMKRTITHIFAAAALILASVSCWNEEMDDLAMGKDLKLRHQVSDLKAVPGDTEVQLSWTMEEGCREDRDQGPVLSRHRPAERI